MGKVTDFYLPRNVVRLDADDHEVIQRLEETRELAAYVLLGEPGSGKTDCFLNEAHATGGHYVKARNFSLLKKEGLRDRVVFIDGLDERRAVGGSGHTPLEEIRKDLDRLGRPRFRLSCREADWLGDSDRDALAFIAPTGVIEVLHLNPLNVEDVHALLAHEGVLDPQAFYEKARLNQLDNALHNPNILKLLSKAVGSGEWPASKAKIFESACNVLARDINIEHQTAPPAPPPPIDRLLEAAGYLCAVLLLSGDEGLAFFDLPAYEGIVPLAQLAPSELPLAPALRTNLFRGPIDSGRSYLHRSVAEFLAARHIAHQIESGGLPVQRILVACTGKDGGVAPDLRGLCAWLSAYSRTARLDLIDRDPLGVVLYGDVSTFAADDKRRVFAALRREAERYPAFRSSDWTTEPFGALSTVDMLETIDGYLRWQAKTDGEQSFQDCVMDAVKHGERMPTLEPLLEQIARNANSWPIVRRTAIEAIERVNPGKRNCLYRLLEDIRAGVAEDRDDELLGHLLHHLYARGDVDAHRVFDYLHAPKQENLIGRYRQFWSPELAEMASHNDLPTLLEELAKRRESLGNMGEHYMVRNLVGEILVRTLEVHGDHASDAEVYAWITAGQDKWGNVRLEHDEKTAISAWIAARPERYKMLAARPIEDCRGAADVAACLRQVRSRLFEAQVPPDIVEWYFAKAGEEDQPEFAEHYFQSAVIQLIRKDAPNWPTEVSLDLLGHWVGKFPKFQRWREDATSDPLDHWQGEELKRKKKREAEEAPRMKELRDHYRKHIALIREGTAPPSVMFELSQVHEGRIIEGHGDTPAERMEQFFGGDITLIEAALTGLPKVLERKDLPSVDEIITTHLAKKHHYLREAALVGMGIRYEADNPDGALALPDDTLEKVCAFWLAKGNEEPDWFEPLAQRRPTVVAAAMIPYVQRSINAKNEHVSGVWQLAHSKQMAAVARLALPVLLEAFPLRAQVRQLARCLDPLLNAALAHMPRGELATMVARKLDRISMDAPQCVYWLATGLLIEATRYQRPLLQFVKRSRGLLGHLASFLAHQIPQSIPPVEELPDSALLALVELLGPDAPSDLFRGSRRRRTSADNLGQLVRILIQTLERRGTDATLRALERMLDAPDLRFWANALRAAINSIRVFQRKASMPQLTPSQASEIVSNQQPANAGDLAAITVGHLRDIALKIREGATNDYKQYWNLETKTPRIENDCRDALLSQLQERLGKYGEAGFPANKEGYVANEQRVDVMVSYGGSNGFAVPIEAKRERYRKDGETVWTALRTQLVERYAKFPNAAGHGIYLVFWFDGKHLPPSPTGITPKTPAELEEQLRATLAPEDSRIHIVVIDCSMPIS